MLEQRAEDLRACERMLAASGSTFALPIRLLPRQKRLATTALYAFCRLADDIADAAVDGDPGRASVVDPRGALAGLRRDLADAFDGGGKEPVVRAVADAARQYGIPRDSLVDVIDGVETDLVPPRFATFPELEEYCRRVASAVGLAAIHIWGFRCESALAPAHDCGVAFQLTNILRDLREDADAGRVYLPDEDFEDCESDRAAILAGRPAPGVDAAIDRLLERARDRYARAVALDRHLTTDGRTVFRAMFGSYAAIFRRLVRHRSTLPLRRDRAPKPLVAASAVAAILLGPAWIDRGCNLPRVAGHSP